MRDRAYSRGLHGVRWRSSDSQHPWCWVRWPVLYTSIASSPSSRRSRVSERILQAVGVHTVADVYRLRGELFLIVRPCHQLSRPRLTFSTSQRNEVGLSFLLRAYLGLGRTTISHADRSQRKGISVERTFHPEKNVEKFYKRVSRRRFFPLASETHALLLHSSRTFPRLSLETVRSRSTLDVLSLCRSTLPSLSAMARSRSSDLAGFSSAANSRRTPTIPSRAQRLSDPPSTSTMPTRSSGELRPPAFVLEALH